MKTYFQILFSLLFLACLAFGCSSVGQQDFIPGEVLVTFEDGTSQQQAQEYISSFENVEWKEPVSSHPHLKLRVLVSVPVGEEQEWIERFENSSIVLRASLNQVFRTA